MSTLITLLAALTLAQTESAADSGSATLSVEHHEHPDEQRAPSATMTLTRSGDASGGVEGVQPPENQLKPTPQLDPHPPADRRRWSDGATRTFYATTFDAGYLYVRPRLSLGYGKPHFQWLGVEINPIAQNTGVGGWAGLRFELPVADLRIGAREFYEFQYSYLTPQSHYDRLDLDTSYTGHATYTTAEAELSGAISLGFAEISGLVSASYITGVPAGKYVFEANLRVLAAPPWVLRERLQVGFYPVPGHRNVILGPVVDVLEVPKRDEILVRAGFAVRVVLSRAFEMRGNFVPSVASRDSLGFVHSDFTELGLRYRWASDEQPSQ